MKLIEHVEIIFRHVVHFPWNGITIIRFSALKTAEVMTKKARFTESQIVSILKLANSGMKIDEICRQNGISNATYYIYGLPPFCKY